ASQAQPSLLKPQQHTATCPLLSALPVSLCLVSTSRTERDEWMTNAYEREGGRSSNTVIGRNRRFAKSKEHSCVIG
ncbi:Chromodomain-helicase-DNA-binding protein 1, partial [Dissostichus eleginoides]